MEGTFTRGNNREEIDSETEFNDPIRRTFVKHVFHRAVVYQFGLRISALFCITIENCGIISTGDMRAHTRVREGNSDSDGQDSASVDISGRGEKQKKSNNCRDRNRDQFTINYFSPQNCK